MILRNRLLSQMISAALIVPTIALAEGTPLKATVSGGGQNHSASGSSGGANQASEAAKLQGGIREATGSKGIEIGDDVGFPQIPGMTPAQEAMLQQYEFGKMKAGAWTPPSLFGSAPSAGRTAPTSAKLPSNWKKLAAGSPADRDELKFQILGNLLAGPDGLPVTRMSIELAMPFSKTIRRLSDDISTVLLADGGQKLAALAAKSGVKDTIQILVHAGLAEDKVTCGEMEKSCAIALKQGNTQLSALHGQACANRKPEQKALMPKNDVDLMREAIAAAIANIHEASAKFNSDAAFKAQVKIMRDGSKSASEREAAKAKVEATLKGLNAQRSSEVPVSYLTAIFQGGEKHAAGFNAIGAEVMAAWNKVFATEGSKKAQASFEDQIKYLDASMTPRAGEQHVEIFNGFTNFQTYKNLGSYLASNDFARELGGLVPTMLAFEMMGWEGKVGKYAGMAFRGMEALKATGAGWKGIYSKCFAELSEVKNGMSASAAKAAVDAECQGRANMGAFVSGLTTYGMLKGLTPSGPIMQQVSKYVSNPMGARMIGLTVAGVDMGAISGLNSTINSLIAARHLPKESEFWDEVIRGGINGLVMAMPSNILHGLAERKGMNSQEYVARMFAADIKLAEAGDKAAQARVMKTLEASAKIVQAQWANAKRAKESGVVVQNGLYLLEGKGSGKVVGHGQNEGEVSFKLADGSTLNVKASDLTYVSNKGDNFKLAKSDKVVMINTKGQEIARTEGGTQVAKTEAGKPAAEKAPLREGSVSDVQTFTKLNAMKEGPALKAAVEKFNLDFQANLKKGAKEGETSLLWEKLNGTKVEAMSELGQFNTELFAEAIRGIAAENPAEAASIMAEVNARKNDPAFVSKIEAAFKSCGVKGF